MCNYKSINHFGGDTSFEQRQINDNIKLNYTIDNEIPFIIIPYNISNKEDIFYKKEENIQKTNSAEEKQKEEYLLPINIKKELQENKEIIDNEKKYKIFNEKEDIKNQEENKMQEVTVTGYGTRLGIPSIQNIRKPYHLDAIRAEQVNKSNLQNKVDDLAVVSYSNVDTGEVSTVFVAPKIQKNADPQKNNEPIFYTTQKHAESPAGWSTYLMNNLDRDLPYRNKAVAGKYTVRLSFVVNQNGDVENVIAENDPGYGTAKEAVRVIQKGPKWTPAEQNGHRVIYRHRQVIGFQVTED